VVANTDADLGIERSIVQPKCRIGTKIRQNVRNRKNFSDFWSFFPKIAREIDSKAVAKGRSLRFYNADCKKVKDFTDFAIVTRL
jgi:hypothetical protein